MQSSHFVPDRRQAMVAIAAMCAISAGAQNRPADTFPTKPIQLVFPFPPGGSMDPIFRTLSEAAAKELGQPVVMMHRPGAGGVMGTASLAAMNEADGYTIAVMHNSVIRAPLVQKVTFDPLKDFTYLTGLFGLTTGIAVAADAPWKTLGELLADAKKRPGAISWGTVGAISINRIVAERLARTVDTTFNMVPFKGGGEAFTALIGRHLDVYGDPGYGAQVRGGRARLLATFTAERVAGYPNVPTVKELGYDLTIDSPMGLVAPKNLDPKIALRLAAAFRKATSDPTYLNLLALNDLQPNVISGEAYTAYARMAYERDAKMLAEIGFKLD
ncbi:MAG: tripartite tricarboxylate transporter substrate binding protein [Rhodoferax sp.]